MKTNQQTITILYPWNYVQYVLKTTEGGPGVAVLKSAFKHKPIKEARVTFGSSPLVGHTAFRVEAKTEAAMKAVGRVLKSYGYVKSIKETLIK